MDDLGIVNGVQGGQVSGLKLSMPSSDADKFSHALVNRNQVLKRAYLQKFQACVTNEVSHSSVVQILST